jgi:hypothetical protein
MSIQEPTEGMHIGYTKHVVVWPIEQPLQEHPQVVIFCPLGSHITHLIGEHMETVEIALLRWDVDRHDEYEL